MAEETKKDDKRSVPTAAVASEESQKTVDPPLVTVPVPGAFQFSLMASRVPEGAGIELAWTKASDALRYTITVATAEDCSAPAKVVEKITTQSAKIDGIGAGNYFVCMAALNDNEATIVTAATNNGLPIVVIRPPTGEQRMAAKLISETGLYADMVAKTAGDENVTYEPQYPLWSDGAVKKRWVYLPPNTQIDTSSMDAWIYPKGTVLWKEFGLGEKRLETRVLVKTGDGVGSTAWFYAAYQWRADGSDADLVAAEGASNVLDTQHDIPSRAQCLECHGGAKDFVLGFEALQLSGSSQVGTNGVNLAALISANRLTLNPKTPLKIAGTPADQVVLGYFHSNCGPCHNPTTEVYQTQSTLTLRHESAPSRVEDEPGYQSTVNHTGRISGGLPDSSGLVSRIEELNASRMPRLGSEVVDTAFSANLRAWIVALPVPSAPKATSGELKTLADQFCVPCHGSAGTEDWWYDRKILARQRIKNLSMPKPPSTQSTSITAAERERLIQAIETLK